MNKNPFNEEGFKKCPGCGEEKHQEEFYNSKSTVNGKLSRCKTCVDATNKEWREANPEKVIAAQKAWRVENEGHTYTDKQSGYVTYIGYNHPIANPSGVTPYHRIVLWNEIGPGQHECYWGCGRVLSWGINHIENTEEGLVVDHLNGIKNDNRPENLAPSCQPCNSGVSRLSRKVFVGCFFEGCDKQSAAHGLCRGHLMQKYSGKELTPLRKRVIAQVDENGRTCTECDEHKPLEDFSLNSSGRYRSKCRKCLSLISAKNTAERIAKNTPCSEDDCKKPALTKGLCSTHYSRAYQKSKEVAA
ncbi:HNH endonuclease [Streptomyces sp. NPDC006798]|uniref:HNH endonuclease n=1 Tax=unclassified Streptomyces TaxID=2593676 RepID=UPI0033C5251B